ncbi:MULTISPECIES: diguanylate cyclase [unclassified Shewanella]|jgi:diguanylate cyclase (GGDEF)-like protein/PAS domain S-box-containing protein|uniref:diguanylate cyclase domain-containing protein n=1 Tax=unclassified Shewanella TaxID=196818 RepID=UPI000C33E6D7|nr:MULTISPECIES: diguanylate cyclase [unclassified Shewanella]MBB1361490.1 diguanylate cyclase [Shewanella sp. SR44-4]PKH29985.1 diguanylate cyclase [Shewanella sp. ALD9]QHS13237.1 diguanylate cyclase [Shewanella sp. Arc9-LZ]|tara:strand:- start:6335 stop:7219 length:885 start_codon:yes stop_codon:yes gene_type:complete
MKTIDVVALRDVMDLMLDAVCVVDKAGNFVFVSAAFEDIFGYSPDEVIGKPMLDHVYPEDGIKTLKVVESLLSGKKLPRFENRWVRKDGKIIDILWSARWSEDHQFRIAVAHDITERKLMEQQLHYIAGHDPLTELPNRALLFGRLQTSLGLARREGSHLSLLFIDIDGFKHVNDSYGHLVGDKLLKNIAQRLRDCVRKSDTVGRFGGDEFVVVLNGIDSVDSVLFIAENIRLELEKTYQFDSLNLQLSPSIGVARYPDNGADEQQLIQYADQAMYRAKNAGGNRIDTGVDHLK